MFCTMECQTQAAEYLQMIVGEQPQSSEAPPSQACHAEEQTPRRDVAVCARDFDRKFSVSDLMGMEMDPWAAASTAALVTGAQMASETSHQPSSVSGKSVTGKIGALKKHSRQRAGSMASRAATSRR